MNPESIDKITQYLDKVATKLGVGVETIWPWFVKQQFIEVYMAGIWLGIFIVLGLSSYNIATKVEDWEYCKGKKDWPRAITSIILAVIAGVGLLFSTGEFAIELGGLFNPEYYAFTDLLKLIK